MDNRTIGQVRANETKLIYEIDALETKLKKQKEIIETLKKAFDEIEEYMQDRMCEQAIEEGDTYKPETAYIRHITIDTDVVCEIIEKAKKSL